MSYEKAKFERFSDVIRFIEDGGKIYLEDAIGYCELNESSLDTIEYHYNDGQILVEKAKPTLEQLLEDGTPVLCVTPDGIEMVTLYDKYDGFYHTGHSDYSSVAPATIDDLKPYIYSEIVAKL